MTMSRAGFLQRFIAFVVDALIIGAFSGVLAKFYGIDTDVAVRTGNEVANIVTSKSGITYSVINFLIEFVYFGYFWSSTGQSLGMKLLGIKVVKRDSGALLSFFMSGLRGSAGYWISGIICGLGYLWALFDSNNEAWHDKLFGSAVIRV
jgi:uncharacterized RDD family membrane protein YckC